MLQIDRAMIQGKLRKIIKKNKSREKMVSLIIGTYPLAKQSSSLRRIERLENHQETQVWHNIKATKGLR